MKRHGLGGVRKSIEDQIIRGLDRKFTVSDRLLINEQARIAARPITEMYSHAHLNAAGERVWSY